MKILFVFIDQLRSNLLHTHNDKIKKQGFDQSIESLGGVLFSECFTPGPNTFRSLSCLWTSLYPPQNGCDNGYSRYHLKNNIDNIFELFIRNGYEFNYLQSEHDEIAGVLPKLSKSKGLKRTFRGTNPQDALNKFINDVSFSENSITFISLSSFYAAMNRYGYNYKSLDVCYGILSREFDLLLKRINTEQFDNIITFSDHGYKLDHERGFEPFYKQSNSDRTKIFLHFHKKGDELLTRNDKFCSILDIFPTIVKEAGITINNNIMGHDLFSDKEHEYIVIEDQYTMDGDQYAWSVRYKNAEYYTKGELEHFEDPHSILSANSDVQKNIISEYYPGYKLKQEEFKAGKAIHKIIELKSHDEYLDGTIISKFDRRFIFRRAMLFYKTNFKKIILKVSLIIRIAKKNFYLIRCSYYKNKIYK